MTLGNALDNVRSAGLGRHTRVHPAIDRLTTDSISGEFVHSTWNGNARSVRSQGSKAGVALAWTGVSKCPNADLRWDASKKISLTAAKSLRGGTACTVGARTVGRTLMFPVTAQGENVLKRATCSHLCNLCASNSGLCSARGPYSGFWQI